MQIARLYTLDPWNGNSGTGVWDFKSTIILEKHYPENAGFFRSDGRAKPHHLPYIPVSGSQILTKNPLTSSALAGFLSSHQASFQSQLFWKPS